MSSTAELRRVFLDYFHDRGHEIVPSSSLVPANDPTLLFTNAGMVQFKDVFLGLEQRPFKRAASSQRCVRAGGKHNDLENVGYTARHHTFFEMLGNFSFGDYFKHEAIAYAWEFLTSVLQLPAERLWITTFEQDDQAADIWLQDIGVDARRFVRIGAKDNFWAMGDTGPCGPCSEIFYDHGPKIPGGPPGSQDGDNDRYVEIWNLVFMQYNRSADGTLTPLPEPSVDTGMGLERLAAVLQGVHNNYDIDIFHDLIQAAAQLSGTEDLSNNSLRVIADHIRACAFLIIDGVVPSNEGRGYVLRRIIRRAARHGYELGSKEPFFYRMVAPLSKQMGQAYPELPRAQARVERVLRQEEERFIETLAQGIKILNQDIAQLSGKVIPGDTVFKLYDTYGFPVDLTADIALAHHLTLDMKGFERAMNRQRERARGAGQFNVEYPQALKITGSTKFTGYEHGVEQTEVIGLFIGNQAVDKLDAGQEGTVILAQTPFYGESGGQVGDCGVLTDGNVEFEVSDTQKLSADITGHSGIVKFGVLHVGDSVAARIDTDRRQDIASHHSATHLLHAALRRILGDHVTQQGSLVEQQRLRFDFSHSDPLTLEQTTAIEQLVNMQIRANNGIETQVMTMDDALAGGATALFGEKYGEMVRVLSMGDFSIELCGGTHVKRTGDIGLLKIISETSIAAGVRRIEAVAGQRALDWLNEAQVQLARVMQLVKGGRENVDDKVRQLLERNRKLEKELEQLKGRIASQQGNNLVQQAVEIAGLKVLAASLEGADLNTLRNTVDQLKNKLGSAVVVLATVSGGKVSIVAGVTTDCTARIKAGELVNEVAKQVGGKGGGRPDMAQAGGNRPEGLEIALHSVSDWVRRQLGD